MDIRPELDDPSPEAILYRCDAGFGFRHAGGHRHKCPYNCLRSDSLYPIDRSYELVLKGIHLDIRGIIHYGDDRRREELTRRSRC